MLPAVVIRGPGLNNWDAAVFKTFPIREPVDVQFRFEFYNAFNHTQFTGLETTARFDATGNQISANLSNIARNSLEPGNKGAVEGGVY